MDSGLYLRRHKTGQFEHQDGVDFEAGSREVTRYRSQEIAGR
jgi:hypothetical protein